VATDGFIFGLSLNDNNTLAKYGFHI